MLLLVLHLGNDTILLGFPCGPVVKTLPTNAGDAGLILGWKGSLEKELATHSSILAWESHMDRGVWWATVHGVVKASNTT